MKCNVQGRRFIVILVNTHCDIQIVEINAQNKIDVDMNHQQYEAFLVRKLANLNYIE